jgi:Transcription factor Iwr1
VLDTKRVPSSQSSLLEAPVPLSAISAASKGNILQSPGVITPVTPTPASPIIPPERVDTPPRHDTFGNEKPRVGGLSPVARDNHDYSPEDEDEDNPKTGTKRKMPVRRYHLAKRLRVKHPHPYSNARVRSAIFMRVQEPVEDKMEVVEVPAPEPVKERKRPRTHPEERRRLEEQKQKMKEDKERKGKGKEVKFKDEQVDEDDPLTLQLQSMVLEYLNAESNEGIRNLPAKQSPAKSKQDMASKIGGGLGGGTWEKEEEEEGFVYDVYIREELPATEKKKDGEDYGVLVFEDSDDEEWWYEGDKDENSDDDVWASDDEDSNG